MAANPEAVQQQLAERKTQVIEALRTNAASSTTVKEEQSSIDKIITQEQNIAKLSARLTSEIPSTEEFIAIYIAIDKYFLMAQSLGTPEIIAYVKAFIPMTTLQLLDNEGKKSSPQFGSINYIKGLLNDANTKFQKDSVTLGDPTSLKTRMVNLLASIINVLQSYMGVNERLTGHVKAVTDKKRTQQHADLPPRPQIDTGAAPITPNTKAKRNEAIAKIAGRRKEDGGPKRNVRVAKSFAAHIADRSKLKEKFHHSLDQSLNSLKDSQFGEIKKKLEEFIAARQGIEMTELQTALQEEVVNGEIFNLITERMTESNAELAKQEINTRIFSGLDQNISVEDLQHKIEEVITEILNALCDRMRSEAVKILSLADEIFKDTEDDKDYEALITKIEGQIIAQRFSKEGKLNSFVKIGKLFGKGFLYSLLNSVDYSVDNSKELAETAREKYELRALVDKLTEDLRQAQLSTITQHETEVIARTPQKKSAESSLATPTKTEQHTSEQIGEQSFLSTTTSTAAIAAKIEAFAKQAELNEEKVGQLEEMLREEQAANEQLIQQQSDDIARLLGIVEELREEQATSEREKESISSALAQKEAELSKLLEQLEERNEDIVTIEEINAAQKEMEAERDATQRQLEGLNKQLLSANFEKEMAIIQQKAQLDILRSELAAAKGEKAIDKRKTKMKLLKDSLDRIVAKKPLETQAKLRSIVDTFSSNYVSGKAEFITIVKECTKALVSLPAGSKIDDVDALVATYFEKVLNPEADNTVTPVTVSTTEGTPGANKPRLHGLS